MSFGTGFALYFLFWWLCLFAVLPFGARSQIGQGEVEPGTEPGAPVNPQLLRKIIATTILAAILFGLYWFITVTMGYSLDDIPSPFPQDRQGS